MIKNGIIITNTINKRFDIILLQEKEIMLLYQKDELIVEKMAFEPTRDFEEKGKIIHPISLPIAFKNIYDIYSFRGTIYALKKKSTKPFLASLITGVFDEGLYLLSTQPHPDLPSFVLSYLDDAYQACKIGRKPSGKFNKLPNCCDTILTLPNYDNMHHGGL